MSFDLSIYDDEQLKAAIERREIKNIHDDLLEAMKNELINRHKPAPVIERIPVQLAPKIKNYSGCGSKLTESQKEEIKLMKIKGHTHYETALKVGCSVRSVQRVLNDALMTNFSTKVSYDANIMDKIVDLSNRGHSIRQICHMLKMDNDVVRRWVNKSRARAS